MLRRDGDDLRETAEDVAYPCHIRLPRVQGNRRRQCTKQGVTICLGHRCKDLALDTLHGEQRQKGSDHNGRREKDGFADFYRAEQNGQQLAMCGTARLWWTLAPLQMPEDVLDHD